MANNFDSLFEQLLTALQAAEKRHRTVRDSASDNSDWKIYDIEGELISSIVKWRRSLEPLCAEISSSGAVTDDDIFSSAPNVSLNDSLTQAKMPSHHDDERIGRYVCQKMKDLSISGYNFSEETILNLQNPQWCNRFLNIPYQFFLQTTDEMRYYWKRDIFVFNGKSFRLCMLWYNDLYRGRSQRECFDIWYDSLTTNDISIPVTLVVEEKIKVGKHIQAKLLELSESGFIFTQEQIMKMCDLDWSRQMFTYDRLLPFAKIADIHQDISAQTKDENGHGRYWNSIFQFGDVPLLIISQWYTKDKESFDQWYESLLRPNANTMCVVPIKTKPTKFTLFGKEYIVKVWNEMFVKVCEVMLLYSPYHMAAMDKDTEFNTERRTYFTYINSNIKVNGKRLSNGLWVETNMNNQDILKKCHKLLEKCEFSPNELQVEIMEVL